MCIRDRPIRGHLDHIKKCVPGFIPEFVSEFVPEFDLNSDLYSGTNAGMNSGTYFFMSSEWRLRVISLRCSHMQLNACSTQV